MHEKLQQRTFFNLLQKSLSEMLNVPRTSELFTNNLSTPITWSKILNLIEESVNLDTLAGSGGARY